MRSAPQENPDNSVPEIVEISYAEFMEAYPTWLQWRQTDRKFLPTELRRQPQPLFDNILYIDSLMEKIIGQYYDRMKQDNKNG